ncbi:TRAPP complex subunit bet5 [Coemansia biformis]|uniref:Trafficking protein particle complex subunit n=1 Tax=Coemansia biformis TaxID=1286918 RepID=A0A9W7YBU8_9FUNG|nr:TRAPP complex subunit bet5 [Coemansia biformis]
MVVIYNIYIFDRHCECVFYTEWNRHNSPLAAEAGAAHEPLRGNLVLTGDRDSRGSFDSQRPLVWPTKPGAQQVPRNVAMEEEAKLVYGIVFSTRNIISKLAGSTQPGNGGGFLSLATNTYRMHYYEAPTGVKFVLNTDVNTTSMQPVLEMIYRNIYVEYVVKNPLFHFDPKVSAPIENDYFRAVLNNYIQEISSSSTTT